jgi:hypothetical protein
MLRRRALHATSSVRSPRRAVRDRALTCAAAALNVSALALPEVARLLETPESRVAFVWHWPLNGVRIGTLLRSIGATRRLGAWPQKSVSDVFGTPWTRTCEPHSFHACPRVS